jgi:hypothetical protein
VASLICKELPLGSLLALRETCKTTREWVDVENRSTLTEAMKEVKIDFRVLSDLASFLKEVRNLPFSNFSLNVRSIRYYGKCLVIQFMERYGPIIRRLSVSSFWKCASDAEWEFYEGLTVLEQLVIDEIALPSSGKARIPSCIQKLKLLDISSAEEFGTPNAIPYCFRLLKKARELETFTPCYIVYLDSFREEEDDDEDSKFKKYLRHFMSAWDRRRAGLSSDGDETLKVMNLYQIGFNYDHSLFDVKRLWQQFIQKILDCPSNIMLHRVSSNMLECVKVQRQRPLLRRFAERVVSLGPVLWSAKYEEMPNLEVIWKLDDSDVRSRDLDRHFSHPKWPKLKQIYTGGVGLNQVISNRLTSGFHGFLLLNN